MNMEEKIEKFVSLLRSHYELQRDNDLKISKRQLMEHFGNLDDLQILVCPILKKLGVLRDYTFLVTSGNVSYSNMDSLLINDQIEKVKYEAYKASPDERGAYLDKYEELKKQYITAKLNSPEYFYKFTVDAKKLFKKRKLSFVSNITRTEKEKAVHLEEERLVWENGFIPAESGHRKILERLLKTPRVYRGEKVEEEGMSVSRHDLESIAGYKGKTYRTELSRIRGSLKERNSPVSIETDKKNHVILVIQYDT